MEKDLNLDTLGQLCAEIEQDWKENQNPKTVDRLAKANPDYAESLYEFLSMLIFGEAAPQDTISEAISDKAETWLDEKVFDRALAVAQHKRQKTSSPSTPETSSSAPKPKSFIRYLRDNTGELPDKVAEKMENTTPEFLISISWYPDQVPLPVRQKLAHHLHQTFNLSENLTLSILDNPPPSRQAASRSGPIQKPTSFSALLDQSNMTDEQETYWLQFAHGEKQ